MGFNFIGEVNSLRERQIKFICEILDKRGFKNCDVLIEPMGKAGDNFAANVKRIVINQNGETFKMIAKLAPEMREVMDTTAMFKNEHVLYTEIFPKFRELQKNAGVPEKDWFRYAECYGTFIEAPNEVILLEDLKEKSFDILNKFKPMPIECIKLTLRTFAIFHSLSFALKNEEPELFAEAKSKLGEVYVGPPELFETRKQLGQQMENDVLANLSDERHKTAFKGTMSVFHEILTELTEHDKNSQYSVIQQGDGWTNNIMFTFEDNQPTQCILIDYQIAKESNPIYDIMYLLFNSIDSEQRIKLYNEFIDYYYNELDKSLSNYGLKVNDVYPRQQLNADMRKNVKLLLAVSIIVTYLIIKDVEEASKLQESMKATADMTESSIAVMMEKNAKTEMLFKNRVEGLAKTVIELELL